MAVEPWPEWFQGLRPHQEKAVAECVDAFERGVKVVWLDGPTGTGKTIIGEAVRRALETRALYICSGKTLQDQFSHDFPYARVLKGRKNYATLIGEFPEISCDDCSKVKGPDGKYADDSCSWCWSVQECPYEMAKAAALHGDLAVLNMTYFLTETNYIGRFSKQSFVIMDECDVMESELMRSVEFALYPFTLKMLGIEAPKKGSHKSTIEQWIKTEMQPAVEREIRNTRNMDDKGIKRKKKLERLRGQSEWILGQLHNNNWVRDNNAGPLVVKPVSVAEFGQDRIWKHSDRWLCMSATIISADQLAADLGLEDDEYEVVKVPMTFPVENRKIYAMRGPNMTSKTQETAWPEMCEAIQKVLDAHPDERVLVHTVSYKLAEFLHDWLVLQNTRDIITYRSAKERDEALARYRKTVGSVLLASSMDRGVDLADDDCRVVVVAKIPFPYLGDPQVSMRMHLPGGDTWYKVQTVRTLVQQTGRGVRNAEDHCVTYILDGQFLTNVYRNKSLFPEWWEEALKFDLPISGLARKG